MEINNEIKNWLTSSRDFEVGLQLLAKYSKNKHLIQALNRKKTTKYAIDKLEYELTKNINKPIVPGAIFIISEVSNKPFKPMPETISLIRREYSKTHNAKEVLKKKMAALTGNKTTDKIKRANYLKDIKLHRKKLVVLGKYLEMYEKNEALPKWDNILKEANAVYDVVVKNIEKKEDMKSLSAEEIKKRIANARSNITKVKSKYKKLPEGKKKISLLKKEAEYINLIDTLKAQLNG